MWNATVKLEEGGEFADLFTQKKILKKKTVLFKLNPTAWSKAERFEKRGEGW